MSFIQGYRKVTISLRHIANTRAVKPLRFLAHAQGRFARDRKSIVAVAKSLNSNVMSDNQIKAMNLAVAIEQLDAAEDTLRAAKREISNATTHLEDSDGYNCYQIEKALEIAEYLLQEHLNHLIKKQSDEPF